MMPLNKKIRQLINDASKAAGTDSFSKIIEKHFTSNFSENEMHNYNELKLVFSKLRDNIKSLTGQITIAEKIKEAKKNGRNRTLTEEENRIRINMQLILEREILITKLAQNIENKSIKLKEIEFNLDKYLFSNFYRTICEISIKLFSDVLLILLRFDKDNSSNEKEILSIDRDINKILNDSAGLSELKSILSKFDNKLNQKLNLAKIIDTIFLFEENKGFSLRNNVAHEKLLFSEINNNKFLDEIKKVNTFNVAFMMVFYFDVLGAIMSPANIEPARNVYNV